MEGGVQRRSWNKTAPVGAILLLVCMFFPTLASLQPLEECPPGDYLTDEGFCCDRCPRGYKLVEKCHGPRQRSTCVPCPAGQFMDQLNYFQNCRSCKRCKKDKHEIQVSKCESHSNTICGCEDGYYKFQIDSETSECRRCSQCKSNERQIKACTPENNTVCECKENYYKVKNKCELCESCNDECRHRCPSNVSTRAPAHENAHFINVIAGIVAAAGVLLALVVVITYIATKWSTKKRLTSSLSDDSADSCKKVLVDHVEPSNGSMVKADPPSPPTEQEQLSSLPDCVPLEIKIPDLIYTVLDLVPPLQVKQLVRSLGVRDTEIEQAELDHRSCREAHYQMLKAWVERGSHAGGGRGEMLHLPLLQELLEELRKMYLGQAAEELETKYGIQ